MNGDVLSGGLKKFGQTRPPIASSTLAAVSSPISLDKKKRATPLQTGHTGKRANFSVDFTFRGLAVVEVGAATLFADGDEENLALGKRTTAGDAGARNASQTVNDRDANTMVGALILACVMWHVADEPSSGSMRRNEMSWGGPGGGSWRPWHGIALVWVRA